MSVKTRYIVISWTFNDFFAVSSCVTQNKFGGFDNTPIYSGISSWTCNYRRFNMQVCSH